MAEVPARPGEEAWYGWLESLLEAAAADPEIAGHLTSAAVDANQGLVADLFQFRNIGLPLPGNWSTQRNGARFGTDYLSRTAMGTANIFVNTPEETTYFYQDLDEYGERLDGSRSYAVTFPLTACRRSGASGHSRCTTSTTSSTPTSCTATRWAPRTRTCAAPPTGH